MAGTLGFSKDTSLGQAVKASIVNQHNAHSIPFDGRIDVDEVRRSIVVPVEYVVGPRFRIDFRKIDHTQNGLREG